MIFLLYFSFFCLIHCSSLKFSFIFVAIYCCLRYMYDISAHFGQLSINMRTLTCLPHNIAKRDLFKPNCPKWIIYKPAISRVSILKISSPFLRGAIETLVLRKNLFRSPVRRSHLGIKPGTFNN